MRNLGLKQANQTLKAERQKQYQIFSEVRENLKEFEVAANESLAIMMGIRGVYELDSLLKPFKWVCTADESQQCQLSDGRILMSTSS